MKPQAWAVVAVAAMVAAVAWRFARRSKLALAIALVATTLAGCGLAFAAGGWSGCTQRGDCGSAGAALRVILIVETLLLPLLLLVAGVRALWRRFVPEREPRGSRPRVRGDARRMRLRDVGLTLGGAVFGLAGLAMVVLDHGQDRIAGLAVLLFAIAVLVVPLSGRLAARSGLEPRLESVEHDGAVQRALVIPGSRAKQRLMIFACLAFAAMGALMAIWPDALASTRWSPGEVRIGGIFAAVCFGVAGVPSLLLTRGPVRIEFVPDGLQWQIGAKPAFATWDAIDGVRAYSIHNTWFLGLAADPAGLRIPPRQRWLIRANRAISGDDASISLEPFPVEPEQFAEAVAACAMDPERRREIGTGASLRWLRDGVPPQGASVAITPA